MKVFEIDNGKEISIGSMNQDNWSFLVNNEVNVHIQSKTGQGEDTYRQYLKIYQRLWKECRYVDKEDNYSTTAKIFNAWWDFFFYCSHATARDRSLEAKPFYKNQ